MTKNLSHCFPLPISFPAFYPTTEFFKLFCFFKFSWFPLVFLKFGWQMKETENKLRNKLYEMGRTCQEQELGRELDLLEECGETIFVVTDWDVFQLLSSFFQLIPLTGVFADNSQSFSQLQSDQFLHEFEVNVTPILASIFHRWFNLKNISLPILLSYP